MSFRPVPHHIEKADILLVNPDFSKNEMGVASPPENHVGLNRIATYLKSKGHVSQTLDTTGRPASTHGPEELGDWLADHSDAYRFIGFHVNSWNINHILRALDRADEKLKTKPLLFGGPLPSSEPFKMVELLIEKGLSNFGVAQGFGEKVTDDVLSQNRIFGIDGLWAYRDGKLQPGRKLSLSAEEFEALPILDLEHNTFYQNYFKPVIESGDLGDYGMELIFGSQGLEVNRGCPFNCTYCSVPQYEEKLITFSPKRAADEIEYLAKEAGFFMFTFTNSNILCIQPDWLRAFCREMIGRGMSEYINWTAYHHPSILSRLDVADCHLLRKAGCDTLVFGVQSFEEKILKLFMRPPNTKTLTQTILEKARAAKLQMTIDYITGVPGEDLDEIEAAFRYFADNQIECRNYQLKLYPNTKLQTLKMDLSQHDLVPITGNLAPELTAYAIVGKTPNPRSAQLDAMIRNANADLLKSRPVRLGKYIVDSPQAARRLLEKDIPENPAIPLKVKRAMSIALSEMLNPKKREKTLADLSPAELMKTVVTAGPDAPPMVLAMQKKLRNEMGDEAFEKLKKDIFSR